MFTTKEMKTLKRLFSMSVYNDLSLDGVHGYLFGLAIIPETIMPSEWVPEMFGDDMLATVDDDEAHRLLQGLFAIYNRIMSEERDGKLTFPFDISAISLNDISRIRQWTEGLFRALNLRPEIWGMEDRCEGEGTDTEDEDVFSEEEDEMLTCWAVISGIAFPDRIPELFGKRKTQADETRREAKLFALLPSVVESLRRHAAAGAVRGRAGSYPAPPQPRRAEKVGRNEPCPCGSGSKYKKCCGK